MHLSSPRSRPLPRASNLRSYSRSQLWKRWWLYLLAYECTKSGSSPPLPKCREGLRWICAAGCTPPSCNRMLLQTNPLGNLENFQSTSNMLKATEGGIWYDEADRSLGTRYGAVFAARRDQSPWLTSDHLLLRSLKRTGKAQQGIFQWR